MCGTLRVFRRSETVSGGCLGALARGAGPASLRLPRLAMGMDGIAKAAPARPKEARGRGVGGARWGCWMGRTSQLLLLLAYFAILCLGGGFSCPATPACTARGCTSPSAPPRAHTTPKARTSCCSVMSNWVCPCPHLWPSSGAHRMASAISAAIASASCCRLCPVCRRLQAAVVA